MPADVDSDAVLTRGMYGKFIATSYGDGIVSVGGSLRVGGVNGSLAELRGDDELWAELEGEQRRMSGGDGSYHTRFDSNGDKKEVLVSFRRGEGMEAAPHSTVTLPRGFEMSLSDLEPGDDLERGQPVVVRWSPANPGGTIVYRIRGGCIWSAAGTTSDDGEHVVTAREIQPVLLGSRCDVVVELTRRTLGLVDPNFEEGGDFEGYQVRSLNFSSTPAPSETELENSGGAVGQAGAFGR